MNIDDRGDSDQILPSPSLTLIKLGVLPDPESSLGEAGLEYPVILH
jgi:hypothetical protein